MSTLYIVATPIGNLSDITYRAVETLKSADVIAAEDTRNTGRLLAHYNISKKLIACHSHNEKNSSKGIIQLLDQGQNVALVTDAGTPGISDPGLRVVEECLGTEHKIVPIPGASAATALVSVAGNAGKSWIFEGFLPKTSGRQSKRLDELLATNCAFIIYESPFRIVKLLETIRGKSDTRRITLGREITKIHEEFLRGTAGEILDILKGRPSIKGEIAIIVHSGDCNDNCRETDYTEN